MELHPNTLRTPRFAVLFLSCAVLVSGVFAVFGGEQIEKGTPEDPPNAKAIVGIYYRGDGTGYNIDLNLNDEGKYTAVWNGCLGKYGEASGTWSLNDKCITFKPSKEDGMMKGHLKNLDVLKFKGHWIFVPTGKDDRRFYDKWGVCQYSCFQNTNSMFRGQ